MVDSTPAESERLAAGLVAELQLFAKAKSPQARNNLELPLLRSLCDRGSGDRSVADHIETAIPEVTKRAEVEALAAVFPSTDVEWETNLSGRKRQAASHLGMSYDSFRRRRGEAPSPYDSLCFTLARQLVGIDANEVEAPNPAVEPISADEYENSLDRPGDAAATGSRRKAIMLATFLGLVGLAVGTVGAINFWPQQASEPSAESALSAPPCQRAAANAASQAERVRYAVESELLERGRPSCVAGTLRPAGEAFFYDIGKEPNIEGGAVVTPTGDGNYSAALMPTGPWLSYSEMLGSVVPTDVIRFAGLASGEIIPSHGGYTIETDGGGYFYGPSAFGQFHWMPDIAYEVWVEGGAENGPLGSPTSSIYVGSGGLRGDFENGTMLQHPDGSIESIPSSDSMLSPVGDQDLAGTVITSRGGHAWFVDHELRLWWIASEELFECAGGVANISTGSLSGAQIDWFEPAGVARCPMGVTGMYPLVGPPSLSSYCLVRLGVEASSTAGGGWRCANDDATDVDPEDVCRWQFGPTAQLTTEPDKSLMCRSAST